MTFLKIFLMMLRDGLIHGSNVRELQSLCLEITKIACLITKLFIDHRKDLKAIIAMCTQKK